MNLDLFNQRIDENGPNPEINPGLGPCHLWLGFLDRDGYGRFSIGKKSYATHRFIWEIHNGKIPKGMTIDHICRVPKCVNPNHLRLATSSQNAANRNKTSRNTSGYKGVSKKKGNISILDVFQLRKKPMRNTAVKALNYMVILLI